MANIASQLGPAVLLGELGVRLNGADSIVLIASALLIGIFQFFMPVLTRPEIFFSVTVPADFRSTPAGLAILRQYRIAVVIVTAVALSGVDSVSGSESSATLALVLQAAICAAAFLWARAKVQPHAGVPTTEREAELTNRPARSFMMFLLAPPFAAIAYAAWMVVTQWQRLPEQIPVHWDIYGEANGWVPKTPVAVWSALAQFALTTALLALCGYGLIRGLRRIHLRGRAGVAERWFVRISFLVILCGEYLTGLSSLAPFGIIGARTVAGASLAMLILALPMVLIGQGGSRLAPAASSPTPVGDRTPDDAWILGVIYFNRQDPAFFVEKRFGIGYTVNFAHPLAWTFVVLVVAGLALPVLVR